MPSWVLIILVFMPVGPHDLPPRKPGPPIIIGGYDSIETCINAGKSAYPQMKEHDWDVAKGYINSSYFYCIPGAASVTPVDQNRVYR